jgi:hypothetical protein
MVLWYSTLQQRRFRFASQRICYYFHAGPSAFLLLQFQGAIVAMLLAVGWIWSGAVRLRELRRVQAAARSRVLRAAAAGGDHAGAAGPVPQLPPPPSPPPPAHQPQPGQLNRRGSHGSLAAQQPPGTACGSVDLMSAAAASASAVVALAVAADGREQRPAAWPAVTVVLPVKGRRAHSGEAWASQLGMRYGEAAYRVHPAT